eukprot:TRINITY_DN30729_c0_g1_i1.p1 TRINITY_DN30729_c0_g1~~TRINITY_DN30729_c0_g1_i1.p1  ORF type:complete len:764 (+),score=282.36 TRINITY_DN30729_c0_g1_i1:75-2294(+)
MLLVLPPGPAAGALRGARAAGRRGYAAPAAEPVGGLGRDQLVLRGELKEHISRLYRTMARARRAKRAGNPGANAVVLEARRQMRDQVQAVQRSVLYGDEEAASRWEREEEGPGVEAPPVYLDEEQMEAVGVRDRGEDGMDYPIAIATLQDRGCDVGALFGARGCPSPTVVLLHLIERHQAGKIQLADHHIATVLDRQAEETALLPAEERKGDAKRALRMREACHDAGLPFERLSTAALLRCCVAAGDFDQACGAFEEMVMVAGEKHYALMMQAAVAAGEPDFALELWEELHKRRMPPGDDSALHAVAACAAKGDIPRALSIRESRAAGDSTAKLRHTAAINKAVLNALAQAGRLQEVRSFAAEVAGGTLSRRTVHEAVVTAAARSGEVAQGIAELEAASAAGIPPTRELFHALIEPCAAAGDATSALLLARLMRNCGVPPDTAALELIAAAAAAGEAPDAGAATEVCTMLRNSGIAPSPRLHSLLVRALAAGGDTDEALRVWEEAHRSGQAADAGAGAVLLRRLADAPGTQLVKALTIWREHRDKGGSALWGALAECLAARLDDAPQALQWLRAVGPPIEARSLQLQLPPRKPCQSLGDMAQWLRGCATVHVLSSVNALRRAPAKATACSKVVVPFTTLLRDTEVHDHQVLVAVPNLEVALLEEQLLAHVACGGPSGWAAAHEVDLRLASHRSLALAALLRRAAGGQGCDVRVVAEGAEHGGGKQGGLADRLGVPVLRL